MQSNQNVEVFNSINHKILQLSKTETRPSIHRVRKHLRDISEKAYEPEIIAIGPYHHGKDSLKWMEEHKLRYLQLLLDRRKQNVETYISAIGELEQKARDCYAEPINLSGAKFVEMLILDGCFIIELVRKYIGNGDPTRKNDPIFQTQWITGSLGTDLMLFENQIPFFVLCKLFDLIEGQNQHQLLIRYLLKFCSNLHSSPRDEAFSRSSQEMKHLLDMVYGSWFSSTEHPIDVAAPPENEQSPSTNHSSTDHPIDVAAPPENEQSPSSERGFRFIRSATELKNANVEFRKKECNTLFDVEFKNGLMEMPSFPIDDSTERFLRNLIVYEQYVNRQQNPVTDYMVLLDCLINSSKDVELLSECRIIDNWLGSNEAVANIINRLCYLVVCDGKHFVYANLFAEVNKHYEKGWNRSMAMLRLDIFYSPWACISFVVGVIVLELTIVQTVCSVLERL